MSPYSWQKTRFSCPGFTGCVALSGLPRRCTLSARRPGASGVLARFDLGVLVSPLPSRGHRNQGRQERRRHRRPRRPTTDRTPNCGTRTTHCKSTPPGASGTLCCLLPHRCHVPHRQVAVGHSTHIGEATLVTKPGFQQRKRVTGRVHAADWLIPPVEYLAV